jgi:hypothetical protein
VGDRFGASAGCCSPSWSARSSAETSRSRGAGNFFSQVWLYGGFAIVGILLGYWIATALGRDYRSGRCGLRPGPCAKPRRVR